MNAIPLQKPVRPSMLTPFATICIGFAAILILIISGVALLKSFYITLGYSPSGIMLLSGWSLVFMILSLGPMGLRVVPVAHRGVPLLLGTRLRNLLFEEGIHWIPRLICSIETVNVMMRTKHINSIELMTLGNRYERTETEVGFGKGVLMTLSIGVQWRIENPYLSLSIGESEIDHGLEKLVVARLRQLVAHMNDVEFMTSQQRLADEIVTNVGAEVTNWGVKILAIFISNVVPRNQSVIDAFERSRIEESERGGEETQQEFVIKLMRRLMNEGFQREEAYRIAANERGKLDLREIILTTRDPSELLRAAGMMAANQQKNNNSKKRKGNSGLEKGGE